MEKNTSILKNKMLYSYYVFHCLLDPSVFLECCDPERELQEFFFSQ